MISGKLIGRLGVGLLAAAIYKKLRARQPGDTPDWLECEIPDSKPDSKEMPRNGGSIRLQVEPGHVLRVPGGALPPGTKVTLTALQDVKPGVRIEVSRSSGFRSKSIPLAKPATLQITYRRCKPKGKPAKYGIWNLCSKRKDDWKRLGGEHKMLSRSTAVELPSFSTYALAAN
jgi:hypothetical protein